MFTEEDWILLNIVIKTSPRNPLLRLLVLANCHHFLIFGHNHMHIRHKIRHFNGNNILVFHQHFDRYFNCFNIFGLIIYQVIELLKRYNTLITQLIWNQITMISCYNNSIYFNTQVFSNQAKGMSQVFFL